MLERRERWRDKKNSYEIVTDLVRKSIEDNKKYQYGVILDWKWQERIHQIVDTVNVSKSDNPYPNRKKTLNTILFTDFLFELKSIEKES